MNLIRFFCTNVIYIYNPEFNGHARLSTHDRCRQRPNTSEQRAGMQRAVHIVVDSVKQFAALECLAGKCAGSVNGPLGESPW